MKILTRFLPLLACLFLSVRLVADDATTIAAVRAADDARAAAMLAGDTTKLDALLSTQLRYAHSSGRVDTKTSYLESIATKNNIYHGVDYAERNFVVAAPGVVVMSGRITLTVTTAGQRSVNDLNFLAVWREEGGHWKFLAWQSAKNPPVTAPDNLKIKVN